VHAYQLACATFRSGVPTKEFMLTHRNLKPVVPTRIVVLGRDGFVPRALVQSLTKTGWPVLALGKDTIDLTHESAASKLSGLLRDTDAVVFTSALTPEKGRDTATLIKNLRMAESVAAAIAAKPFGQLIYFSSDSVYGWQSSVLSEATPPSPDGLYGVMHLAREIGLREVCKKAGIPFAVLRACAIYGFGDTHKAYGPNRFVRTAVESRRIEMFGAGDDSRDHVYIDDVVAITRLVLEHRSEGLLNLVSGNAVTFGHIAEEIVRLIGSPVTLVPVHRPGPATHRSFLTDARSSAFPKFSPTPLPTGLRRLIDRTHGD
jgi:UDP-glucose 4-epimerase